LLRDAIANFVLYIPLGFAYSKARRGAGGTLILEAAIVGLLLSMTCELYQVFSPVRFPSMTDVLLNGLGALVGASIRISPTGRM
jgi:VanZ family protein